MGKINEGRIIEVTLKNCTELASWWQSFCCHHKYNGDTLLCWRSAPVWNFFPLFFSHFFHMSYRFGLTCVHGVNLKGVLNSFHLHPLCLLILLLPQEHGHFSLLSMLKTPVRQRTQLLNGVGAIGLIYTQ